MPVVIVDRCARATREHEFAWRAQSVQPQLLHDFSCQRDAPAAVGVFRSDHAPCVKCSRTLSDPDSRSMALHLRPASFPKAKAGAGSNAD